MRAVLPVLLCTTIAVTGCSRISDSRFNPLNWFGPSETVAPVDSDGNLRPLVPEGSSNSLIDTRGLANSIVSLAVDRTPDGAIVRAIGTTNAPGQFNAELVPVGFENGTLTLAFRLETPQTATSTAIEPRQITAAFLMSNADLFGVRNIQVQAAQNSRVVRR